MAPLTPVTKGDPLRIPADVWNALAQLLKGNAPPPGAGGLDGGNPQRRRFRITAKTALTADKVWEYTGKEVIAVPRSSGDWYADKAGGITDAKLYNVAEERNGSGYSGEYGNGIATDALTLHGVPVGRVVDAWHEPVDGGYEWRFSEANGGECP